MKTNFDIRPFLAPPPRPASRRYSVMIATVLIGLMVRKLLTPAFGPQALPFISFFPAVAVAAWYGGLGPALLSITLSAIAANWFFLDPAPGLSAYDLGATGAFLIASLFISGAMQAMHRASAVAVHELTERQRTEQALRLGEQRATAFLNNSAIVAWLKDEEGRNVFLSDNYVRRFGLQEWKNKTDFELWPRDVAEIFRKNDLTVLGRERPFECIEEARTATGEVSYWLNSKFWFQEPSGKKYVGGIGVDITERKKAEEGLREQRAELEADLKALTRLYELGNQCVDTAQEQEQCLKAIVETGIAITGAEKGNIQLLDPETSALRIAAHHGFDEAFLKFFGTVTSDNAAACGAALQSVKRVIIEDVTKSELFANQPSLQVLLDANVRAVQSTPLLSSAGHVLGILSTHFSRPGRPSEHELRFMDLLARQAADYLERKDAEEALRKAHAQLADRAVHLEALVAQRTAKLGDLVSELQHVSYAIVHDMRAPLRAMSAFAAIVLDHFASAPDCPRHIEECCRRIVTAAERLDDLIRDSLSYTKTVLREVQLQPVDLGDLLRELIETYPNLQSENADIVIENGLPVVLGERSLLTQCFSNLLGNAVKFVLPGVRPQVHVRSQAANGLIKITVEDNGIGIPPQAQTRLFGMFERLTNDYEGTGIGLAIVRKVTERMGGRAGAESELGKGSRFWVELRKANSPQCEPVTRVFSDQHATPHSAPKANDH